MNSMHTLEKMLGTVDPDSVFVEETIEPRFELIPVPEKKTDVALIDQEKIAQNKADDYEYTRETMVHLIGQGNSALQGILTMATTTDNPKVYDSASNMIKTIADVAKDLNKMNNEIAKDSGIKSQKADVINNNQIVMSQKDMIELLNNKKKNDDNSDNRAKVVSK